MRAALIIAALINAFGISAMAVTQCAEQVKIPAASFSAEVALTMESNLRNAESVFREQPESPEALIWFGRRTAYLARYKEAIDIFTTGIKKHPADARMYRHRGHRLLTLRCFDDAVSDFQKAVELIQGKPDQIEPDGIPNARNTPTSTLQSNIWYHLGLAYYLKGDFRSALEAYRKCMLVSKNPDMLVATANWHYITARRTGENEEAQKVLASIEDGLDIIENGSYYDLIKLYQGKLEKIDLAGAKGDNLSSASVLYGVGNWVLLNNDPLLAQLYFERILAGDQWSSFGYIAAETELARIMKKIED